ncbi:MAG TPA: hypothetical protein VIF15_09545 [Polyangiaceae bacterium]
MAALVACKGNDGSAGSAAPSGAPAAGGAGAVAAPPDACSVASPAEISAALGDAFTPSATQPSARFPTVSVCNFNTTGGKTLIVRTETIDRDGWETSVKMARGARPITGVGDEAYFQPTEIMHVAVGQLLAYKGKTFVSINYAGLGLDMGTAEAAEKALMLKILAKI